MGHKHDHDIESTKPLDKPTDPPVPITQHDVDQAIASGIAAGELAPQPPELRAGQALCGKRVRMLISGHMTTVELTDYDISSDSYHGLATRCFAMADEKLPVQEAVHGARRYPTTDRPNYSWQWVEPGADESVLINIAHNNLRQPE